MKAKGRKNITMDIILKCNPCQKKKEEEKDAEIPAAHLKKEDQSRVCVWAMSSC